MPKISNFQRAQATRTWLKLERPKPLEEFIQDLCTENGLEYTPPLNKKPTNVKVVPEKVNMFPSVDTTQT